MISYIQLNIEVFRKTDNSRYANGNDIRLVNLDPFALFKNFTSTKSSRKHLEDYSHAHIVSLVYNLITSPKHSDDLSIEFDRDSGRRQQEVLTAKT